MYARHQMMVSLMQIDTEGKQPANGDPRNDKLFLH